MSLKLEQTIKKFHGDSGTENFERWYQKYSLVAKLQSWTEAQQAQYLPLFLEDAAWSVYDQLESAHKSDLKLLLQDLTAAFSPTPADAFAAFQERRYIPGEPIDNYVSNQVLVPVTNSPVRPPPAPFKPRLSNRVSVSCNNNCISIETRDFSASWNDVDKFWSFSWKWNDRFSTAVLPIGSGITQYPVKLTDVESTQVDKELSEWLSQGIMVPYVASRDGPIGAVLPLLPVRQPHKASSPIRICVDARDLNGYLCSAPGSDLDSCTDKLRTWRQLSPNAQIVDLRRAYLQVRLNPRLWRFQVIYWNSTPYVLTRMSFGLVCAPHTMSSIIRFILDSARLPTSQVDSYLDDLYVSEAPLVPRVISLFQGYGLPCKPPEDLWSGHTRVLGLQLYPQPDTGLLFWTRRSDLSCKLPSSLTKRTLFSWVGRLVSHYPVASWLRVWSSFLKRLACSSIEANAAWDTPLPASIRLCCEELYSRFSSDDPASGVWSLPAKLPHVYDLFCDASSIAVGVVLKQGHYVLEDGSWLVPPSSQLHINLLELNATIRGLTLATYWNAHRVVLHCDSRTVVSWLTSLLEETGPVRVSGLHETLIRRRLAIIAELLESAGICLSVTWIESQANPADLLTRVPPRWVSLYSSFSTCRVEEEGVGDGCIAQLEEVPTRQRQKVTSAAVTVMSPPTVLIQDQLQDPMLREVRTVLSRSPPVDPAHGAKLVPPPYRKVYPQLCIGQSKLLCRQLNVPPNVNVKVPVVPAAQVGEFIKWAHVEAGHGDWTGTWKLLRRSCYFPDMAVKAQQYVKDCCPSCRATRHHQSQVTTGAATTIGDGPWDIIYADTLSMNGVTYLVVTDSFTKWIEAIRLPRNDGRSVCNGLVRLCYRFGAPTVIRTDNGPEMANQYVDRLCAYYHIIHRRGAARHPQSQGSVERANKTILGILRKIIGEARSVDEVDLLVQQALYHYRLRTTATLGISPFLAMYGWEPRSTPSTLPSSFSWDLATWVDKQVYQRAWLNDYIDNVLASTVSNPTNTVPPVSQLKPGMQVMLRRDDRRAKLLPAYESGFEVVALLSPTMVKLRRTDRPSSFLNVHTSLVVPTVVRTVGQVVPSPYVDYGGGDDNSDDINVDIPLVNVPLDSKAWRLKTMCPIIHRLIQHRVWVLLGVRMNLHLIVVMMGMYCGLVGL